MTVLFAYLNVKKLGRAVDRREVMANRAA